MLDTITKWVVGITEVLVLVVGLIIVFQVLFGATIDLGPADVVGHIADAAVTLDQAGAAGLVAIGIIIWIFHRRSVGRRAPPAAGEGIGSGGS